VVSFAENLKTKEGTKMRVYSKTDIGRRRTDNQDAFYVGEFEGGAVLAVVCDGMGGAKGGNVASEKAATLISEYIVKSYSPKMSSISSENLLRAAVESANAEVYDMSRSDEKYEGMGTTVVTALVIDNLAHIVHVGDSRAYLIGASEIERITNDHSMVQAMINNGEIDEAEAKNHPKKNIITRAVGAERTVASDYNIVLKPDNAVLLICTDGLSGCVDKRTIFETVSTFGAEESVDRLIDLANKAGGPDNITVVTIK
jgi:protein phosphatase